MPTAQEIEAAYKTEYVKSRHQSGDHSEVSPESVNAANHRYHQRIVEVAAEHGGTVLEVGCGYGGMWELARSRGLAWEGIDLSAESVDYCRRKGLPARLISLSKVAGRFDAIAVCFVFEHLVEHDAFLQECRTRLAPGGRVITLQPSAPFSRLAATVLRLGSTRRTLPTLDNAFTPPWHTTLISIPGFRTLAQRNGFAIERIEPSPVGRFGSRWRRAAQSILQNTNAAGWSIFGDRWPLVPAHLVVLRAIE